MVPLHFKQTREAICGPRNQAASVEGNAPTVALLGIMIESTSGITQPYPALCTVSQEFSVKYRFSILMPVYNRQNYVGQAIDSVLAQTFKDYELFAIDDGSTDFRVSRHTGSTTTTVLRTPKQLPMR